MKDAWKTAEFSFSSSRSAVFGMNGAVASRYANYMVFDIKPAFSQPDGTFDLESRWKCGGICFGVCYELKDACVAMAAVLAVTEPCSTGIGGDAFCMFYDRSSHDVLTINGTGKTSKYLDLTELRCYPGPNLPLSHGCAVTGAVSCWHETYSRFGSGRITFEELLKDSIRLASEGYPVSRITAKYWKEEEKKLRSVSIYGLDLLKNGQAPTAGDVITLPILAGTLETISKHGPRGFYEGRVADAIVEAVHDHGGQLTLDDLASHQAIIGKSITGEFGHYTVHQCPPNSQGIVTLVAIGIFQHLKDNHHEGHFNETHALVESLREAFQIVLHNLGDSNDSVFDLLTESFLKNRAEKIDMNMRTSEEVPVLTAYSDTVYFCAVDKMGNACSFINSTYTGFGSGIVPKGCGFSLHNRGCNFIINNPNHPNAIAADKRPYHTLMPGMLTHKGELVAAFGVMGAFMQPQGQLQVLHNMIVKNMNPQEALDAPRFCLSIDHGAKWKLMCEEGIDPDLLDELRKKGHDIEMVYGDKRSVFGRGQIILQYFVDEKRVLCCGSDPRADGCAMSY